MFIRLCICVYLAFSALPAVAERPITVFAAASLSTVLNDVVTAWKGTVSVSYGGSGILARQVARGAPADLVLLANTQYQLCELYRLLEEKFRMLKLTINKTKSKCMVFGQNSQNNRPVELVIGNDRFDVVSQ